MPTLPLKDSAETAGKLLTSWMLQSVMHYPQPHEEQERMRFLANLCAEHLGHQQSLDSLEVLSWFHLFGGFATVAQAHSRETYNNNHAQHFKEWQAAGLVLILVWQIEAHHPDLRDGSIINQAFSIIAAADPLMLPSNINAIKKAWSKHQTVAHFCAAEAYLMIKAMQAFENKRPEAELFISNAPQYFIDRQEELLALSEAFQNFGLSYRPIRAKAETLLNADTPWRMPEPRFWRAPRANFNPGPINDWRLKALLNYRSPAQN